MLFLVLDYNEGVMPDIMVGKDQGLLKEGKTWDYTTMCTAGHRGPQRV